VRHLEITSKRNRERQLAYIVPAILAHHAQQPHARFALIIFPQLDGIRQLPR